jgi:hypothetical protein
MGLLPSIGSIRACALKRFCEQVRHPRSIDFFDYS